MKLSKLFYLAIWILLITIGVTLSKNWLQTIWKTLFFSRETTLKETLVTIKEVNDISRWITAEYCGEVLYSLQEGLDTLRNDSLTASFYDRHPKRDLVVLGRGWVKAGYDLKGLDINQIEVLLQQDILFIKGFCSPSIIPTVSHINSWFVPEKVKGFEVVSIKKKNEVNSADQKLVESGCFLKLKQAAIDKGILQRARESAEYSLLGFFHVFGHKDIKQVRLVQDLPTVSS